MVLDKRANTETRFGITFSVRGSFGRRERRREVASLGVMNDWPSQPIHSTPVHLIIPSHGVSLTAVLGYITRLPSHDHPREAVAL